MELKPGTEGRSQGGGGAVTTLVARFETRFGRHVVWRTGVRASPKYSTEGERRTRGVIGCDPVISRSESGPSD